jgi:hypothetical protein
MTYSFSSAAADAPVQEVTVQAQRELIHDIDDYIAKVTAKSFKSLPRWHQPVCPMVSGMPRRQAEFVLSRMADIAKAADVPFETLHLSQSAPGEALKPSNCEMNLYVMVTPEPEQLADKIRKRRGQMMGDTTRSERIAFVKTDRPVRVWYTTNFTNDMGRQLDRQNDATFGTAVIDNHAEDTRLKWNEAKGLNPVIVIVDSNRAQAVSVGQLADYIGFVALVQVDLDAVLGDRPTILNLFRPADALPEGLSDWDQAFLKTLYASDQNLRQQRSHMTGRMVHDITAEH